MKILFCVFGLICVIAVIATSANDHHEPVPAPETEVTPAPTNGSQWGYSAQRDSMGRTRSVARVTSVNTLSFGSSGQEPQHGTLTVRRSAEWGLNILLGIERGQFLCSGKTCTVGVRFDSGPVRQFKATGPADYSTTVLFLQNEQRFLSQMRKAHTVHIEATFFQEGLQTFEFNVEGFKQQ
jgi:hypothetical protein